MPPKTLPQHLLETHGPIAQMQDMAQDLLTAHVKEKLTPFLPSHPSPSFGQTDAQKQYMHAKIQHQQMLQELSATHKVMSATAKQYAMKPNDFGPTHTYKSTIPLPMETGFSAQLGVLHHLKIPYKLIVPPKQHTDFMPPVTVPKKTNPHSY